MNIKDLKKAIQELDWHSVIAFYEEMSCDTIDVEIPKNNDNDFYGPEILRRISNIEKILETSDGKVERTIQAKPKKKKLIHKDPAKPNELRDEEMDILSNFKLPSLKDGMQMPFDNESLIDLEAQQANAAIIVEHKTKRKSNDPIVCDHCGHKIYDVYRHVFRNRIEDGEIDVNCPKCKKQFSSKKPR